MCADIPVLMLPMFAEQERNAFIVNEMKIGKYLEKTNLTQDVLTVFDFFVKKNNISSTPSSTLLMTVAINNE